MNMEQALIGIFLLINVVSFFFMMNDKRKSIFGGDRDRTPEGILFFLAGAFGAGGIYLGMLAFRHKTRKWYFQIGIPLLFFQNLSTAYVLSLYFL
jgi:uncharacterized membrane protein YsdA (DUF1294 family)